MSGDGLLSLRWNNHRTSFLQVLSSLRNKQTYSDITIACSGRFYSVHKLVLSACSDYFVEMMEKTPCKHPVIVLKDIRHQELEALLNYMYLGEVNVLQNDLAGLIKAAECLRIKGLAVPDESPSPVSGVGGGGGGGGGNSQPPVKNWERGSPQSKKRRIEEEGPSNISSQPRKKTNVEDRTEVTCEGESSKETSRSSSVVNEKPVANNLCEKDSSNSPTTSNTSKDKQMRLPTTPREDTFVDTTEIKLEEEEVKYEEDETLPGQEASNTLEVQMIEDQGSNQGPHQSNEAGSRLKFDSAVTGSGNAGPNLLSPSSQQYTHHPQSFEEIVSQALPGPSGMQGEGSQSWDGSHSDGDIAPLHLRNFPQQDSLSSHHRNLQQMGQARSGWARQSSNLMHPLHQHPVPSQSQTHQSYQRSVSQNDSRVPGSDGSPAMAADLHMSLDKRCCLLCGYKGQDVSQLRKHLRIHTGEKPYQCPHCDYCSAQSSNLRVHMKRHHQQEMPNNMHTYQQQHQYTDTLTLE